MRSLPPPRPRRTPVVFGFVLAILLLLSALAWSLNRWMLTRASSRPPITFQASSGGGRANSSSTSDPDDVISLSADEPADVSFVAQEERHQWKREDMARAKLELQAMAADMERAGVAGACAAASETEQWVLGVPEAALRRSLVYQGDMLRFDRFLHKVLVKREAPTVLVLGSKASLDTAGSRGPQLDSILGGKDRSNPRKVAQSGWLSTALDRLLSSFPPSSLHSFQQQQGQQGGSLNGGIQPQWTGDLQQQQPYWLLNLGFPNATPAVWASCAGQTFLEWLPVGEVDLVVVELALARDADLAEHYDQVLQGLLRKWTRVPVLLLNLFHFCRHTQACRRGDQLTYDSIGIFGLKDLGMAVPDPLDPSNGAVHEDNITVLAQYYSFPALSARNAFYHLVAQKAPGFGMFSVWDQASVGFEPNAQQAQTVYADLILSFFRTAIEGLWERQEELAAETETDAMGVASHLLQAPHPFFQRWRPQDYVLDHSRLLPLRCFGSGPMDMRPEYDTQSLWEVDHGHGGEPMLVASRPGAVLETVLDSRIPKSAVLSANPDIGLSPLLRVEFLSRANDAGSAVLECISGCRCNPKVVDSFSPVPVEVEQAVLVPVTQAQECLVRLQTVESPNGKEFHLTGWSVVATPTIRKLHANI